MPKIVDRDAMQARILDSALGCFMSQGYHATKMTDVAKAADLAKGTLYLYFKSKDAMMVALIDRYFAEIRAQISQAPVPLTLDWFFEGIRRSMPIERLNATRMFFDVLGPGFEQPEARAIIRDFFDWLSDHYAGQLDALRAAGHVRRDLDAKPMGGAIAAMLDGLVMHLALFDPEIEEFARRRDAAIAMLQRGLAC